MDKNNELLPCPFCGCTKIPVQKCNGIGDTWLECTECGAGTRLREDIQSCVKDWNRRAPSASAQQAEPVAWSADWIRDHIADQVEGWPNRDWSNRIIANQIRRIEIAAPAPSASPHPEYTRGWQDCLEMHVGPKASASPAALTDELDLIVSVLTGYPKSMARADALRAVDSIRRLLAASPADQGNRHE